MGCGCVNKRKYECDRTLAVCTEYNTPIPEWSDLSDESCVVLEETTADLYNEVTEIRTAIELNLTSDACITYPPNYTINDALEAHHAAICATTTSTGFDPNMSIETWGLDLECLENECNDTPISGFLKLLQTIISLLCSILLTQNSQSNRIDTLETAVLDLQNLTQQQQLQIAALQTP